MNSILYLLCHLMLNVFLGRSVARECKDELRDDSFFDEVVQFVFINEVLRNGK